MIPRLWPKEKNKIHALKKQCKRTIVTLAELSKSTHASHCVLVLGQPESGKSSLCAATATQLFTSTEAPQDASFEIYLRHTTLFLHIPKDFFLLGDLSQQSRAWQFLAAQLKKLRNVYLTITHSIVCLDLYDVLTRSNISNETRLSQLSTALNSITSTLKTPLNIVLFLTKTDLIPGFNEFFAQQDKEFLQQPWGISLLENKIPPRMSWKVLRGVRTMDGRELEHRMCVPEKHSMTFAQSITKHFDTLIKTLNEQLLWRIHQTTHNEHLHLVKAFPLAMENVKHKLIEILPTSLQQWRQNKFLTTTSLYFISCRQFQELKEREQRKLYFVTQIIETMCQTPNTTKLPVAEKITRSAFLVFACLLLVAFISFTAQSFSRHVALMQKSQQLLQQGGVFVEKTQPAPNLSEISEELAILQKNIDAITKTQHALLIGKFIFSSDSNTKMQLEALYQKIVLQQWIPIISQQLSTFIEEKCETQPEQAYIALKIYLMLNPSFTNNPISNNANFHYIATHLPALLGADITTPTQLPQNVTAIPQKNQLDAINKWRNYFIHLSVDKLAYIIFFSNIDATNALNLAQALQQHPSVLGIDNPFTFIPEIYTRAAFDTIYNKNLMGIAEEAIHGNTILGTYQHDNIAAETLLPQLKTEYLQLYSNTWEEAIKHVYLVKTETLEEFIDQLDLLTSVKSPILSLLNTVQKNTTLSKIEQNSVFLKDFNNTLTPLSTPENSALFHSFILLQNMRAQLIKIQHEQDPVQACRLLKQEYAATSQNPTDAQQVRFYATQLPDPIKTWLDQLVDTYYMWINQAAGECQ